MSVEFWCLTNEYKKLACHGNSVKTFVREILIEHYNTELFTVNTNKIYCI